MKAIRLHARGGPEQLVYEEAPDPVSQDTDALVRVFASGITPTELTWEATYKSRSGAVRLPSIPGHELSGVVEAVGPRGGSVKVGDAVYALTDFWRDGTAAEYVAVRAADLAPKPQTLSYAQAAAVPLSALTAWQALFEHANLTAGQHVLIHGAAGGVGNYAVQLAHWRGAHVIGTASSGNLAFVRELGADEVIDYTKTSFEDVIHNVDVVFDTVGGDTLERSWPVLRRGGALVSIADAISEDKLAKYGVRGIFFIVVPSRLELMEIGQLIDSGAVRPIIEAILPLDQARQAFARGLSGHNRGKIVLRVAEQAAVGA